MKKTFTSYNPYDNSPLGEFSFYDESQTQNILKLLKEGKKIQEELAPFERAEILERLADLLTEHQDELSRLITKEVGKTITDSRVELQRTISTAQVSAFEARNIKHELLDVSAFSPHKNKMGMVIRKPLGIILCITPFNFPLNLAMHKIGPAFAAGNTIFFKPGPQNYQSGKKLIDLCHQAGMPKEVVQFAYPDIPTLENIIAGNAINAISFTGGTKTADAIANKAGRKKLLFELGGNDPLIVMPDAHIDQAVTACINQRFATAGQRCTAAKRVFLHESIYDKFKKELLKQSEKLIIGDPQKANTFIGPVVTKNSADQVEKLIKKAIDDGANCLLGNKREGNIIFPTILENLNPQSTLITEETFGPVIPLIKFSQLDEVITTVNSSPYGLQAGVFTDNLKTIKTLFKKLEVGALAINDGPGFRAEHIPFGGVKDSGLGREGIKYAIEEMSYLKTLIV